MPSLQTIFSCLQQLIESLSSRHRARRSNGPQKSPKTSTSYTPFSPRIAFLEPIDYDRNKTPLLNASRSNTPSSMLSAVTTTGAYSLTNTPSILSSVSFAKSETYLPVLPALPNVAESKPDYDNQSEAKSFVNVHEAVSRRLGFSAEVFGLSENAVDEEDAVSVVQAVPKSIPEPPTLTERDARNSQSTGPTAYCSLWNYHQSPNSPSCSRVEKDEHEIYLNNLRLLHFGSITESSGIADNFLSGGFPFIQQEDEDDDDTSWEEIDLRNYGWQV